MTNSEGEMCVCGFSNWRETVVEEKTSIFKMRIAQGMKVERVANDKDDPK